MREEIDTGVLIQIIGPNTLQNMLLASFLQKKTGLTCTDDACSGMPDEIEIGYSRLSDDIRSGKINGVLEAYHHDGGDYTFVAAYKN